MIPSKWWSLFYTLINWNNSCPSHSVDGVSSLLMRGYKQSTSLFLSLSCQTLCHALNDPGFFFGHAKTCSLQLLHSNVALLYSLSPLFSAVYLLSSAPLPTSPPPFFPYFQLPLFSTPDSTPFLWLWHLPVNLFQSLQVSVFVYIHMYCMYAPLCMDLIS